MPWYRGPTLSQVFDCLLPTGSPVDMPLRIPITDVFQLKGIGTVACGRVATGTFKRGIICTFGPINLTAEIRSMEMLYEHINVVRPGETVGFNVRGCDVKDLKKGFVASDSKMDPATDNFVHSFSYGLCLH